jgi:hypothetical protein
MPHGVALSAELDNRRPGLRRSDGACAIIQFWIAAPHAASSPSRNRRSFDSTGGELVLVSMARHACWRMPRWVDPIPALKRQAADELLVVMGGFSQHFAAALIRSTQSRVSDLRRGRLETMSLDRMIQMLTYARRVVELKISKPPRLRPGQTGDGPRGKQLSRTG